MYDIMDSQDKQKQVYFSQEQRESINTLIMKHKAMVTLLLYNSRSLDMMGLVPAFFVADHSTKTNDRPDASWDKAYEY